MPSEAMVQSVSIKRADDFLQKVIAVQKGLVDTLAQVKTAVAVEESEARLEVLAKLHSQASSGDVCKIEDLKPAGCPPGATRLTQLKKQGESGQEECEQKVAAAKETLQKLVADALQIEEKALTKKMEDHLAAQMKKMEEAKDKCFEVCSDLHDLKPMDDVLVAELGLDPVSEMSDDTKTEKYLKVSEHRIADYLKTLDEVSVGLLSESGLPMNLQNIFAVLGECQAVRVTSVEAEQGRQEGRLVLLHLNEYLGCVQDQRETCRDRRKEADENLTGCLERVEQALEILTVEICKYMDALVANEALASRQTDLQNEDHSVQAEIAVATEVSAAADAALAACAEKALQSRDEIERATQGTARSLKERALKPSTLALENIEIVLNLLSRAEDQKVQQIKVTEQELAATKQALKQKTERRQIAQAKTEELKKNGLLKQQQDELQQVREYQTKARKQKDEFAWLETVSFTFDKTEISRRSQELAKKHAGDFEMFQIPEETSAPQTIANGPESTALAIPPAQMSFIQNQIAEQLAEQLAVKEDERRFREKKLELENEDLKQQLEQIKEMLQARDDRSDARSDRSWDWVQDEGSNSALPALEDGPKSS